MMHDFEQRVAALDPAQLREALGMIATAWDRNEFEMIGVVLEDNGLTVIDVDDDVDEMRCTRCGAPMVINDDGTSNHLIEDAVGVDVIDFDRDEDHGALAPEEDR
jgi:hypothetical protein